MPNSSGFIDFNQQLDATGDSERADLERAMQKAEEQTRQARGALGQAGREAGDHYDANGQLTAGAAGLSQTASYSDYLRAKDNAAQAWAAVTAPTLNPRSVRGAIGNQLGVDAASQAAGNGLHGQEDRLGADIEAQGRSRATEASRRASEAEMKQQAVDARSKSDDDAKKAYLAALTGGARGRAAAGGAQQDYVGGFNPYASSQWAQQQGGWEAQQARNAGAGADQVKGVWNAYTGKGEFGQGENVDANMEREMDPWKLKK